MSWRNAFIRHARRYTLTTLKVSTCHSSKLVLIHAESLQLANLAFAIHFFAEYVAAIEYVSQNTFRPTLTRLSVAIPSLQGRRCSQRSLLKASLF